MNTLMLLWLAKMCVCIHVAFEKSITDENLKTVLIILLIDFAAPQTVLFFYVGYKFASLARKQNLKDLCEYLRQSKSLHNELHPQVNEEQPLL